MRVRSAAATDAVAWDDFVVGRPDASAYHRFPWPTAVERAYGHGRHCLVAEVQGEIVGVLPLVLIRSPLGRAQLCSLPFCDVGGSLADDASVHQALVHAAVERARQLGATLHVRRRAAVPLTDDETFVGKVSMLLHLPPDSKTLFADLKTKVRSQVRKAGQNGLGIRFARDAAALADFYEVLAANMRDLGSPVHSRRWFEAVLEAYGSDATIGVVTTGDKPIGAGMLLTNGSSAAIPWASTLAQYNRLAPNMLLYWHLLEYAIDQKHCGVFDFGRSSFGEGTYRFKKQWGATPVPLEWVDYGENGEHGTAPEGAGNGRARLLAAAVWKRLPLPLANFIGPRLRRFVSL